MTKRIANLQARLQELQCDALLVTNEINVSYLSGFSGDSSYLLIEPSKTSILSDGRYETQIATECPDLTAVIRYSGTTMMETVQEVLGGTDAQKIGIESGHVSLSLYRGLCDRCEEIQWVETNGVVEELRMVKDDSEIEIIRHSIDIAQRSFQSVMAKLRTDWSEREIAHELESTMRFLGAEGVSFTPIIAAGPAGALPHYRPSEAQLGDHPTLLVDWGAAYRGYASDLTRTMHRQHASDDFRRCYQAVLDAQLSAIDKIGPGVAASEVDAAAREVLKQANLGEAFVHGLGHGFGLEIHESPRMSSIAKEILQPGMIVTVEPGVYFGGDFGIRIEDDVLVTETGCEVLSTLPKGLDDCALFL